MSLKGFKAIILIQLIHAGQKYIKIRNHVDGKITVILNSKIKLIAPEFNI